MTRRGGTDTRARWMEAGSWIKSEITKRGETQGEFAARLSKEARAHVTEMDISRLVGGRTKPPFEIICIVAHGLDTTPNVLAEKYGFWKPKHPIGDPRLDRIILLTDRLSPIERERLLSLIDASASVIERENLEDLENQG